MGELASPALMASNVIAGKYRRGFGFRVTSQTNLIQISTLNYLKLFSLSNSNNILDFNTLVGTVNRKSVWRPQVSNKIFQLVFTHFSLLTPIIHVRLEENIIIFMRHQFHIIEKSISIPISLLGSKNGLHFQNIYGFPSTFHVRFCWVNVSTILVHISSRKVFAPFRI